MYNQPTALLPMSVPAGIAGVGAGVAGFSAGTVVWIVLAVFAVVAAGTALMRIVPRKGEL